MLEPAVSQSQEKSGVTGSNTNPSQVCKMELSYCKVQDLEREEQNDIELKI